MKFTTQAVFTVGQVAEICGVAPRTACKWFDSGRLKGFRVPGSLHRKIPREQLLRFMREHGLPMDEISFVLAALSTNSSLVKKLRVRLEPEVEVRVFNNAFSFGTEASWGNAFLIDFSIGNKIASSICQSIRRKSQLRERTIFALLPEGHPTPGSAAELCDEVFRRPFDPELLALRLQRQSAPLAQI